MKRILIILSFATLALLPTGCKKFLDTVPDNRTEINDPDKVHKLLANAYPRKTYASFLEARCDGMHSYGTTFRGSRQSENFEYMRAGFYWMPFVQGDSDDSYERFWEDQYRAIAYCNFALEAIEKYGSKWEESTVKLLRAEARVSRAYHHFTLLSLFSNMFQRGKESQNLGIPYVTEPEDHVFKQYSRRTVERTLIDIEKDLMDELDNLGSDAAYEVPRFRFTRNAGIAFAVRYFLFTGDYDKVITYSNKLINNASTYTNGTGTDFGGAPRKFVAETDPAYIAMQNTLLDWVPFQAARLDYYVSGLYFSNPDNSSYLLSTEVETLTWRTYLGTLMTSYAYDQSVISDVATSNVTGGSWALPVLQLSNDQSAFIVKFYEDMLLVNEAAGIGYVYNKVNLFRLEEVLLSRAEAKIFKSGGPDFQGVLDDLNMYITKKVRDYKYETHRLDRNKIVDFYTAKIGNKDNFVNHDLNEDLIADRFSNDDLTLVKSLLNCIMDFRRSEFIYEGMRYFDVLRWNIPITHTRATDNITHTLWPEDDNRVLQIPETGPLNGLELNPMKNITERWGGDIRYEY